MSRSQCGEQHEHMVRCLCDEFPMAKRKGFMTALKTIAGEPFPDRIIPDAFIVDEDRKAVVAYEVETSHKCDAEKLEKYTSLGWWLDYERWTGDVSLRIPSYKW